MAEDIGYLQESVSIVARHRRCRQAWAGHLRACHHAIRAAVAACPRHRKVVVLGSGPLLDVPAQHLAATFQEVVLVDLIHPASARHLGRRVPRIRLLEHDLTGTLTRFAAGVSPCPKPGTLPETDADLMVSAMVLSQLPLIPRECLERQGGRSEPELEAFSRAIVETHLADLETCSGVRCLITDTVREVLDQGRIARVDDVLYGAVPPPADLEWLWDLAPRPEASPDYDLRHRVMASVRGADRNTMRAAP